MPWTVQGIASWVRLLRWLGPWAAEDAMPAGVTRDEIVTVRDGRQVRLWTWTPVRRPRGACILALGLHPAGPTDRRADRLARVLAHAGYVVYAPFVADFMALRLRPSAIDDFLAACRVALDHPSCPGGRAGVMSVSFGSLVALRAASTPDLADRLAGVLTFGGFADVRATLAFALSGEIEGRRLADDLGLNLPVVFLQILDHLPGLPFDRQPLVDAWMAYVRRSWDDPAIRHDRAAQRALAEELSDGLPAPYRPAFLLGCAARDGGVALAASLLDHLDADHLDARPYLGGLRAPVYVVHGVDDGVIPYTEAARLSAAVPPGVPCEVFLTGMFGHSARGFGPSSLRQVAGEVRTLLRMAWRLANLGATDGRAAA